MKVLKFSAPVLAFIGLYMLLNKLRFDDWRDPGYRYLQIRWQARILRWGLFNYHYLSRNLAVVLALLPWMTRAAPYVQISRHGLALWFTTPIYLILLWPKRWSYLFIGLMLAAAGPLVFDLLYQNSGWRQFGYRFSNDYSILLFVAIAASGRRFGKRFWIAAAWAILWNTFGAISFDRGPPWDKFYWREGTQKILYQDD